MAYSNNMLLTQHPNGFENVWGYSVAGVAAIPQTHTGKVFYVSNVSGDGGAGGNKGTFNSPINTVANALSKCSANRGDIIYVKAGHSETYTAADGLSLNVAGVSVIGLGSGTDRPKFILGTVATTDINVSAANVTLQNLVFEAAFADVTRCIQVTAANFACIGCEFQDQESAENFVDYIVATGTTDNEVDGMKIIGCRAVSSDTANDQFLKLTADVDGLVFKGNYIRLGVATEAVIECATGKDLTNCSITDNEIYRLNTSGDVFIQNDTSANSGIVANNYVAHSVTSSPVIIDLDGARVFNNYSSSNDTESAKLLPAAEDSVVESISGANSSGVNAVLGTVVPRTAADIFDGTTTSIFTIAGGLVAITSITLLVEAAAVDATNSNVKLSANPTTGTTVDICANLDVISDEEGTVYSITGTLSDALAGTAAGAVAAQAKPVIAQTGTIDLVSSADAGTGGATVSCVCCYIPLTAGATVVAA